jgi:adenine-specific DNA-methyltransferase
METKLQSEIKHVLKQFPEYWEDDSLLKNKVIDDLRNYKKDLIEKLLSNETIRNTYSLKLENGTIFKIEDFISMLRYKNYWENSYTRYSNEIGLTSDDKYLKYNTDVVLDFPHKDCVLEGGMTKEDVGKDEIYYHKILAKEEIDILLSPKVFNNIKMYDINGEHEISEFNETDNLIIKGNNLLALHSLKKRYAGKVKMIYIDPPYFFKKHKEKDAFAYNSNYHMSTWLTFMKNRLEVAKELLTIGGTIWISINEDGMHYLKVLADSIFGSDKFIGTTPRRTRNGKSDVPFNYSQDFDFLLAYTNVDETNKVIGRKVERKYYTSDDFPNRPWRLADATTQRSAKDRPNSYFTMVDPKTGKEYPASKKRTWAVTKETFQKYYDEGYIVFPDDYDFLNISKPYMRKFKDEDDASGKLSSVISDFAMQDFLYDLLYNSKNKDGNDELTELVPEESFNYPKPERLLKSIIEIATNEGDIVLDFFMGSATTPAVAMKMNRRFIGIEQMDYIETISVKRLKKVIDGEQGGISKDVGWSGGGSFVFAELYPLNQKYVGQIQEANSDEEIENLINKIKESAFLDFKINIDKVTNKNSDFASLSLEEKKDILIQALDANQLYLSYSEIDDEQYNVPESVKHFNHSFYKQEVVKNHE